MITIAKTAIFRGGCPAIGFISLHLLAASGFAQHAPLDPTKTVGIASCAECHEEIVDRWAESTHARSFQTLLKTATAREIAETVGLKVAEIPVTASCVRCHYTREFLHSAPQTTEAISCESCHGAAVDWINEHNRRSKTRSERVANASAAGMRHPEKIYDMAKSCFECHVVDDEQLVNHTGHPAISDGFELLSWYSGETSHNFMVSKPGRSVKSHASQLQAIPGPRRRMLYLTGKLLHLSQTLKVISRATDAPVDATGKFIILKTGRPTFAVQHAIQGRRIAEELDIVTSRIPALEIEKALQVYRSLSFVTGQGKAIGEAADQIELLAKTFSENHDGTDFQGIDPILEKLVPRYFGTANFGNTQTNSDLGLDPESMNKVSEFVAKLKPQTD